MAGNAPNFSLDYDEPPFESPCGQVEDCSTGTSFIRLLWEPEEPICGPGLRYTTEQCYAFLDGDPIPLNPVEAVPLPATALLLGGALIVTFLLITILRINK